MKSSRVRSQDWQALLHLSSDLAEVPTGDVEGGLQRLLEQLLRIVGARGGFWVSAAKTLSDEMAAKDPLCGWWPSYVFHSDREPGTKELWQRWANYTPNIYVDPQTRALIRGRGRHRTFLRPELVDDFTWERSALFDEVLRPLGIDDRMVGVFSAAPDVEVFVGLDRNAEEKPFGLREREVLRSAMENLGWFHRRVLSELKMIEAVQLLTQLEQRMLPLLLSGRSEKQIARDIGLTVRSTHIYISSIYRKFQVHSRAELMALWLPGNKYKEEVRTQGREAGVEICSLNEAHLNGKR